MTMSTQFTESIIELIRRTTAFMPGDVLSVLERHAKFEGRETRAAFAMDHILLNIQMAKETSRPICQDTGFLTFYITLPTDVDPVKIRKDVHEAVIRATQTGALRQNSIDALTGHNSGNNLGPGTPHIHLDFEEIDRIEIRLIQKGGGCENMGAQYSLPRYFHDKLFGRDLKGVRACILDAINNAQGKGCGPGFLGVCIGGDRATGLAWAKRQFLRPLDDLNPVPELAQLEASITGEANRLGIGPLGFGGRFTLGSCKIGTQNRIPASYFVSIAYSCWAFRRRGVVLDRTGRVVQWLYQTPGEFDMGPNTKKSRSSVPARAIRLQTPLTNQSVQSLQTGDVVLLSGTLYTGRDAVHKYLYEGGDLPLIQNGVFYHCGPIIKREGNACRVLAAGPTTSIREEPYEAEIIRRFGIKAVIGKGGMGRKTAEACKQYGCVYLHAIGGAAQIYAQCITRVVGVNLEEFGSPEAVWELEVENFPAIVTIDAHGNSFHEDVAEKSSEILRLLLVQ